MQMKNLEKRLIQVIDKIGSEYKSFKAKAKKVITKDIPTDLEAVWKFSNKKYKKIYKKVSAKLTKLYNFIRMFVLISSCVITVAFLGIIVGYIFHSPITVAISGFIASIACIGLFFIPNILDRMIEAVIKPIPKGIGEAAGKILQPINELAYGLLNVAFVVSFIASIAVMMVNLPFGILLIIISFCLLLIVLSLYTKERIKTWRYALVIISAVLLIPQSLVIAYPLKADAIASKLEFTLFGYSDELSEITFLIKKGVPIYEKQEDRFVRIGSAKKDAKGLFISSIIDPATRQTLLVVTLAAGDGNYVGGPTVMVASNSVTKITKETSKVSDTKKDTSKVEAKTLQTSLQPVIPNIKDNHQIQEHPFVPKYQSKTVRFKRHEKRINTGLRCMNGARIKYTKITSPIAVKGPNNELVPIYEGQEKIGQLDYGEIYIYNQSGKSGSVDISVEL